MFTEDQKNAIRDLFHSSESLQAIIIGVGGLDQFLIHTSRLFAEDKTQTVLTAVNPATATVSNWSPIKSAYNTVLDQSLLPLLMTQYRQALIDGDANKMFRVSILQNAIFAALYRLEPVPA